MDVFFKWTVGQKFGYQISVVKTTANDLDSFLPQFEYLFVFSEIFTSKLLLFAAFQFATQKKVLALRTNFSDGKLRNDLKKNCNFWNLIRKFQICGPNIEGYGTGFPKSPSRQHTSKSIIYPNFLRQS